MAHASRLSLRVLGALCGGLFFCWACVFWGCGPPAKSIPSQDAPRAATADLALLVIDDAAMASAIGSLKSEWRARTGGNLAVNQAAAADLAASKSIERAPDAIIYPSAMLGTLIERGAIGPLPDNYAHNKELAWPDTFELLQVAETRWAQVPHAVPFGSPVLTCFYRPDLLEALHRRPPETWAELHELANLLHDRGQLGEHAPAADAPWTGLVQPLAAGSAAQVLLARAAAYAKHRDHYSTLFNIETMAPLIGGPAFVRALDELVSDARLGPANQLDIDPAAARNEFLAGHCGLTLSWPSHAGSSNMPLDNPSSEPTTAKKPIAVAFVELPGSPIVYNFANKQWEDRAETESHRVPLLGVAGRLGSITAQTAHPGDALQLLSWLSGQEWASRISAASPATTIYRRSQLRAPGPWIDPLIDTDAGPQYALAVRDALSRQSYLLVPRIPGQEKYMQALDAAARQAVKGDKSPTEALEQAASQWSQITAEIGVESQKKAYRKSLGLEP